MGVLSTWERDVMRGLADATDKEKEAIEKKLNAFQASKTNAAHVKLVNSYIPRAELEANIAAKAEGKQKGIVVSRERWDALFHGAMNRMTRAAGLRC